MTVQRVITAITCSAAMLAAGLPLCAQSPAPDEAAIEQRADALIGKMSLQQKLEYIGGTGFAIRAMPELGLPSFEMSDGPLGVRSNLGFPSTVYAAGIGLAASFDRGLAQEIGAGIGKDARARGIYFMLGPGVNIYRSPRNGRNFEYFGEDPYLAGEMAVAYITGMQQQGVSSTVKHFMGNNSEFLRHDSDSIIDERTMREIYLPAFEAAVRQAHVGAVMDSYNLTNGLHMTQNGPLNIDVLRKEWEFKGILMSDWVATYDAVGAANGGLDLEMPTGAFMNPKNLLPAIKDGQVKEATIDEKIRRILTTAGRFGWLDSGYNQTDLALSTYSGANHAVALQAARENIVLLKNDGKVLPLNKSQLKSILVVGPDAYPAVAAGGGSGKAIPFHAVSALEGLSQYLGPSATVYYERGLPSVPEMARVTNFTTAASGGKPGLTVEFFKNKDLSGTPATTATLPHINTSGVGWEQLLEDPDALAAALAPSAGKQISRRWTGYYNAKEAGAFEVVLQSFGEGNGNRMYIDDKLVIDDWKIVRAIQPHVTVQLSPGPHKVVVEDWQDGSFGGRLRVGITPQSQLVSAHVKEVAARTDVVLVVTGYDDQSESEGGDRTFDLPVGQDELIREMTAANKKTIVAVISGGNVDSSTWLDHVPAYLELWYPGESGGTALAETLFGEVDPSGHLPATFERKAEDNPTYANYYPEGDSKRVVYKEGIFVGYRGYEHNHIQPLFPFGYGLSYTTFKLANLAVSPAGADTASFNVSYDVTNTGDRAGAAVTQVYVSDDHASVPEPPKQLKGFARTQLNPGETQHVTVPLDARAFAYYDVQAKQWRIPAGNFGILVGQSSADIELTGSAAVSPAAAKSITQ